MLTPTYEATARQVILAGRPAGPAGEASLVPVAGVELAFDVADGHLVQAIVDVDDVSAPALLTRLLGPRTNHVLRTAVRSGSTEPEFGPPGAGPTLLSPEPGLNAALSSLARLDAARVTSPVSPGSPWWAAEAAVLADQAGLRSRALAEASRAVRALARGPLAVPQLAAQAAVSAAEIAAGTEPLAARRLKQNVTVGGQDPPPPGLPGLDAAAEAEALRRDCEPLPGLHWVLDPTQVPPGLFRPGLSPHSDLLVHFDSGTDRLMVQATLAAGAAKAAVGQCRAQLVDPGIGRVLDRADLSQAGTRVLARLRLRPEELDETWLEVFKGSPRPVRSSQAHWTRRALRWANAALRAERAPAGLAPSSTVADWAALAALAWGRCRRDWEAAGNPGMAAEVRAHAGPVSSPAFLAEVLGV